jgi:hypothetical protein
MLKIQAQWVAVASLPIVVALQSEIEQQIASSVLSQNKR